MKELLQNFVLIIQTLTLYSYALPLTNGQVRSGILIHIIDENGNESWGEAAPLPNWSRETMEEAVQQLNQKKDEITSISWSAASCFEELERLNLFPSAQFGLESAILSQLSPLPEVDIPASGLLMGTPHEILSQAEARYNEGFTSAKLKVSNLNFQEAAFVIHQLKDKFRLRIDVNRAWQTLESLQFFSQFPLDTFDYVEEPFKNPHDLRVFPHPLAVDESFPSDLSLKELESFPTLKALIYKPTIQGGVTGCLPLLEWARKRGVQIVLSSSFESDIGLKGVALIAYRLNLLYPVGIGTYHFLTEDISETPLRFFHSHVTIPSQLSPKFHRLNTIISDGL